MQESTGKHSARKSQTQIDSFAKLPSGPPAPKAYPTMKDVLRTPQEMTPRQRLEDGGSRNTDEIDALIEEGSRAQKKQTLVILDDD